MMNSSAWHKQPAYQVQFSTDLSLFFYVLFSQEISGLQKCLRLKKLYLYDNHISEIKNLKLQVDLEVLWLNNNCISQIQVWIVISDFSSYAVMCACPLFEYLF